MLAEIFQEFRQGDFGWENQSPGGELVFDLPLSVESGTFVSGVQGLLDTLTVKVKL